MPQTIAKSDIQAVQKQYQAPDLETCSREELLAYTSRLEHGVATLAQIRTELYEMLDRRAGITYNGW